MSTSQTDNVLLNNRRAFSGRQSMEALINYARDQDGKIYARSRIFGYSRILGIAVVVAIPMVYLMNSVFVGSWRSIYSTSCLTTPIEAARPGHLREYFVPEMYIKEREIRKIELGLKDTEEIKEILKKNKPEA